MTTENTIIVRSIVLPFSNARPNHLSNLKKQHLPGNWRSDWDKITMYDFANSILSH